MSDKNALTHMECHHKEIFSKFCPQTGKSLLESVPFGRWVHGSQTTTLWCPGDPGCGKTVLMSAAIEQVLKSTDRNHAVAHLYLKYSKHKKCQPQEMWSNVVQQLTCNRVPPPNDVERFHERLNSELTVDSWVPLLIRISHRFTKTYVFIDGLDEFPDFFQIGFLKIAIGVSPYIRLFLTGRSSLDVGSLRLEPNLSFLNIRRFGIETSQDDIRRMIRHRLDNEVQHPFTDNPEMKDYIASLLADQSHGIFTLADAQVCQLHERAQDWAIEMAFPILVECIQSFYDEAFERIETLFPHHLEIALEAISLVFYSHHSLTMGKVCSLISANFNGNLDQNLDGQLVKGSFISEICVGLLKMNRDTGHVSIHPTLRTYLEGNSAKLRRYDEEQLREFRS